MTTVTIAASKTYDIRIGEGVLSQLGQWAAELGKAKNICIVSETTVYPLHGQKVKSVLENAGFRVETFIFPAGEASKNGNTYLTLLNFLAEKKLTRSDLIVALGGGVVGDLAGFAAATYQRGIRFIQLPTTLLAAVDSSVGGKTAIDLPTGKNMAGAFCQPSLVVCDIDCLNTLPQDIFIDGCAEVIKYGILYDKAFFDYLAETGLNFDREKVIKRCVELKRDVVMEDEFDTGSRMKLNLGHTLGHGVEAKSNFTLSHGKSVAIGMAMISRIAARKSWLSQSDCHRISEILAAYGLPLHSGFSPKEIADFALSDKKRSGGTVSLIVPRTIGSCDIMPTPVESLTELIQLGI